MKWDESASQLKKKVNSNIPFFIRSFVDRTIVTAAEGICRDKKIDRVGFDEVAMAFYTCTPKAMS